MKNTPFTPEQLDQLISQIEQLIDPILETHGEDNLIKAVSRADKKRIRESKALSALTFLQEVAQLESDKRRLDLAASLSHAKDDILHRLVEHTSDIRELAGYIDRQYENDPELLSLIIPIEDAEKWLSDGLAEEAHDRIQAYRSDISLLTGNHEPVITRS